jgi:hypothetical protein
VLSSALHSIPPHALETGESFGAGTACSGVMGEGVARETRGGE